jgi:DNA primase RepB-like protein
MTSPQLQPRARFEPGNNVFLCGKNAATVLHIHDNGDVKVKFAVPNADGETDDVVHPDDLKLAPEIPAIDYINTLFRPDDRVCIFLLPSDGKNIDFRRADQIATPEYMKRLADKNATGFNIYICMNALLSDAKSRTKADIGSIRTVYLDFDDDGQAKVAKVMSSTLVPKPTFVLESSPSKFQVIWSMRDEISIEQQEALLVALISNFGGDTACKDSTRVLRLPGFPCCRCSLIA